jgi:hypothetical protein
VPAIGRVNHNTCEVNVLQDPNDLVHVVVDVVHKPARELLNEEAVRMQSRSIPGLESRVRMRDDILFAPCI